tara:strand:- start:2562 stop:2735 length:174 start_codon:yes stop_codon:yes gene_type:complete
MGRSKVFGIRQRRKKALSFLLNKQEFLKGIKKKIPKRIVKEIETLEHRIIHFSRINK